MTEADEAIEEIKRTIKELEWSVEWHRKKLRGSEIMLDVNRDMLKNMESKR